jgi:predicted HNH restriction endonuclease
MNPFSDTTPIATTDEYIAALRLFRDGFKREKPFSSSPELKMLRSHYNAPQHTITAATLATELSLVSPNAANLRYGTLARNLTKLLDKTLPAIKASKVPHWWRTLAYCRDDVAITNDGQVEWIMRTELCEALEQLGWVHSEYSASSRFTDLSPF